MVADNWAVPEYAVYSVGMDGDEYFVQALFDPDEAVLAADSLSRFNGREALVVLREDEDDVWGSYIYSTEEGAVWMK